MGDWYENLKPEFDAADINSVPVEKALEGIYDDARNTGFVIGAGTGAAGLVGARALIRRKQRNNVAKGPIMRKLIDAKHQIFGTTPGVLDKAKAGISKILGKKAEVDDMDLLDKLASAESYTAALDVFEQLANEYSPEEIEVIANSVLEGMTKSAAVLSSATRNDLPESDFADPENRKFPMPDKEHVYKAWQFVSRSKSPNKEAIRKRILAKAKAMGIDTSAWKTAHEAFDETLDKVASAETYIELLEGFEHLASVVSDEELEIIASELMLEKEALIGMGVIKGIGGAVQGAGQWAKGAVKATGAKMRNSTIMRTNRGGIQAGSEAEQAWLANRQVMQQAPGFKQSVGGGFTNSRQGYLEQQTQRAVDKSLGKTQPQLGMTTGGQGSQVTNTTSNVQQATVQQPPVQQPPVQQAPVQQGPTQQPPRQQPQGNQGGGGQGSKNRGNAPQGNAPQGPIMNDVNNLYGKAKDWVGKNPYMAATIGVGAGMMYQNNQRPYYR